MTHEPTRVVTDASGNALMTRLEGRSPAMEIASDMARRAIWVIPLVVAFGAFWGPAGVLSAGYGLAVVIVNFLLAGWLLGVGGRISFAAMAGAAMFGYLLRLAIITAAVLAVRDSSWFETVPLGVTLVVAHLGLLMWELRYVSGSFTYPGLKPTAGRTKATPSDVSSATQSASAA